VPHELAVSIRCVRQCSPKKHLEVNGALDRGFVVGLVDQVRALDRKEAAIPLAATQHVHGRPPRAVYMSIFDTIVVQFPPHAHAAAQMDVCGT